LRPYVRFGRAGIDMHEVFAWCEDPEQQTVQVYSRPAAVVCLIEPEAGRFLRFVDLRSIDSDSAANYFQAAPAPNAGEPPGSVSTTGA